MGGQQHVWQLTLDPGVTRAIFTTQPSSRDTKHDPYWVGGILPKIGQHQNTLVAIYNPALLDNLAFDTSATHAHFYKEGFEEVIEENGWVVGRTVDTYVALYSAQPTVWADDPSEYANRDLIAEGRNNVWICHVSDKNTSGSFGTFADIVLSSVVEVNTRKTDSLVSCLEEHSCLTGNILDLVNCFSSRTTCQLEEHRQTSQLSQCLLDYSKDSYDEALDNLRELGEKGGLELIDKTHTILPYIDCLSGAEEDISVKFNLNGTLFTFGWDQPFEVQVLDSAPVVVEDDFFLRYENSFSRTDWGSSIISIRAGNKSLSLDLASIGYT